MLLRRDNLNEIFIQWVTELEYSQFILVIWFNGTSNKIDLFSVFNIEII